MKVVIRDPFTRILVGIITDRDLCLHVVATDRDPSTWIDDVRRDPVCCSEQDDVLLALDLMRTHQVRRLPVRGLADALQGRCNQARFDARRTHQVAKGQYAHDLVFFIHHRSRF